MRHLTNILNNTQTFTKFLYFLLLQTVVIYVSYAQPSANNFEKRVDSLFNKWNSIDSPGAVIALLKDNKVIYKKGYGAANLEYSILNQPNTVFDIASLSKQFTAFSIATLVQEGKISLDDDIRKYVPELQDFGSLVTIRHLLTHSSGLRDQNDLLNLAGWKSDDVVTNEQILSLIFKQKELNFKPGDRFSYSNSGYTLLALIVERVTQVPFAEWVKQLIFEPLQMKNTFFITDHNQIIKNKAYAYGNVENGFIKNQIQSSNGARGLQSTVEDLSLWVMNFTNKTIGNEALLKEINTAPVNNHRAKYNYGLAFNTHNNLNLIEHDGSDAGYRTYIGRFPEQNFAIIILSNLESIVPRKIALQIADIYFNNPSPIVNEPDRISIPESVEKGMEGQFQIEPDKLLTIWADDHVLKATINKEAKLYYLSAMSKTTFEVKDLNARFTFKKGRLATVDSIQYETDKILITVPKIFIEDPDSKKLLEFEGEYYANELATSYRITRINNKLTVELPRGLLITLHKLEPDTFSGSYYWFKKVKFNRNEAKRITGFEVSAGRTANVKFRKLENNLK
jgi:CubicO group peptidase (beta-lactamase class C family)